MPVYRCLFDALEETVERIEKSGETIISTAQQYECVVIFTAPSRRQPGGKEQR